MLYVATDATLHGPTVGGFVISVSLFGMCGLVDLSTITVHSLWVNLCKSATMMVWLTHRKAEPMTPEEASRVVELSASIWTNVKDTTSTREAWFLALAHTNLYDALDAVGELARTRKTVHVSDVVKRADTVRDRLLRSLPPVPLPPPDLADDPQTYNLWIKTARERQLHEARMRNHNMIAVPA